MDASIGERRDRAGHAVRLAAACVVLLLLVLPRPAHADWTVAYLGCVSWTRVQLLATREAVGGRRGVGLGAIGSPDQSVCGARFSTSHP